MSKKSYKMMMDDTDELICTVWRIMTNVPACRPSSYLERPLSRMIVISLPRQQSCSDSAAKKQWSVRGTVFRYLSHLTVVW